MTTLESILVGLFAGGFLLILMAVCVFILYRLGQLVAAVDKLNDTVALASDDISAADFASAIKLISSSVPDMVKGVNGLASVMGVFNKAIISRDAREKATEAGTREVEHEDQVDAGGSGFIPYSEEQAAVNESVEELNKQTGRNLREDEARMDRLFNQRVKDDSAAAFFASPNNASPPTMVKPFTPKAEVTIEPPPTQAMEPTPRS